MKILVLRVINSTFYDVNYMYGKRFFHYTLIPTIHKLVTGSFKLMNSSVWSATRIHWSP